jgi:lincosamide nucleotidyltransferase A/C/D/E
MDARRVLDLLARLAAAELDVWLDGGWGVDALLAEQTRAHDDLDLASRIEDSKRLEEVLAGCGYRTAGGGLPSSFELVDDAGHQVDVHPVAFDDQGDGIYVMADGSRWVYPAAGFGGSGSIAGQAVPCLTPEVMLVNHSTGYALDADHERDVTALCERFGLPLPSFARVPRR